MVPQSQQQQALEPEAAAEKRFSFEVVTVNQQGKIVEKQTRSAPYFEESLGDGVILNMVAIPGGTFLMGSPEIEEGHEDIESPQHSVTIAPFHMGKFAVTQAQYQAVVGNNPAHFKGKKRPVENVSWNDAIAFCQKLSKKTGNHYRLPSEAEWEYACRAGTTTSFHFGETITSNLMNFNGYYAYGSVFDEIITSDLVKFDRYGAYSSVLLAGGYRARTVEVGSFPPNGFGLYDMHGNVWEWCADHWHDNYQGAPIDGSAWIDKNAETSAWRVLRGGSWDNAPRFCRSASRSDPDAGFRSYLNGLRVVCSTPRTS
jgi:eukaryotic-like serine/threonine-protein kinase